MAVLPLLESATPTVSNHSKSQGLYALGILVEVGHRNLEFVGYAVGDTGVSLCLVFNGPGGILRCYLSLFPIMMHKNTPNTPRQTECYTHPFV